MNWNSFEQEPPLGVKILIAETFENSIFDKFRLGYIHKHLMKENDPGQAYGINFTVPTNNKETRSFYTAHIPEERNSHTQKMYKSIVIQPNHAWMEIPKVDEIK